MDSWYLQRLTIASVDIVVKVIADTVRMDSKNNKREKITISWSGGKDAALALYKIRTEGVYDVVSLHTVINFDTKRVGMHGVRENLMEQQASCLGIPLVKIYVDSAADNEAYEQAMIQFYKQCTSDKVTAVVFGDIFLEDLKSYREDLLRTSGLVGIFPLWGINTKSLLQDFLNVGFKAILCAANQAFFGVDQLNIIDENFLASLHPLVDPCGERGEFHTFVFDGPIFKNQLPILRGEVVEKIYSYDQLNSGGGVQKMETKFWFQDLLSAID